MPGRGSGIALAPLAHPAIDTNLVEGVIKRCKTQLAYQGLRVVGSTGLITNSEAVHAKATAVKIQYVDLLLILYPTYADSNLITALAEEIDRPMFLWGVPTNPKDECLGPDSLKGITQAVQALQLRGIKHWFVYAHPSDKTALAHLTAAAAAAAVYRRLPTTQIGLIGEPPVDHLQGHLGVQVVSQSDHTIIEQAQAIPAPRLQQLRERLANQVKSLDAADAQTVDRTLALYDVLRATSRANQWNALTMNSESFTKAEYAADCALALLNDKRFPATGGGDLDGALTQFILGALSGGTTTSTMIVSRHPESGDLIIGGGQIPPTMADPESQPRIITQAKQQSVRFAFPLRPGPVTLCRFSQKHMVLASGTIARQQHSCNETTGVLQLERPAPDVLDTIINEGLDHAFALAYGDHRTALLALADLLNLPVLAL